VAPGHAEFDLAEPVSAAARSPSRSFRVNAESPGRISAWATARGVPLVHVSTQYVFDGMGERPWTESDPTGLLCRPPGKSIPDRETMLVAVTSL